VIGWSSVFARHEAVSCCACSEAATEELPGNVVRCAPVTTNVPRVVLPVALGALGKAKDCDKGPRGFETVPNCLGVSLPTMIAVPRILVAHMAVVRTPHGNLGAEVCLMHGERDSDDATNQ
jgi:hypothetical protein